MGYAEIPDSGRRLARLTLVLLLHAAVIYVILHHSAKDIVEFVPRPLETKLIEEVKPPAAKPPPPAAPKLAAPPPPYIPLPEVRVQAPTPPPPVSVVTDVKPAQSSTPAASGTVQGSTGTAGTAHVPVRVAATKQCEDKPVYPPASKRANETGTTLVSFLVDVDGRVVDTRVERSSGYHRLDEASRNAYRLCRFKPATVDGQPQKSWTSVEYVWRLE